MMIFASRCIVIYQEGHYISPRKRFSLRTMMDIKGLGLWLSAGRQAEKGRKKNLVAFNKVYKRSIPRCCGNGFHPVLNCHLSTKTTPPRLTLISPRLWEDLGNCSLFQSAVVQKPCQTKLISFRI